MPFEIQCGGVIVPAASSAFCEIMSAHVKERVDDDTNVFFVSHVVLVST